MYCANIKLTRKLRIHDLGVVDGNVFLSRQQRLSCYMISQQQSKQQQRAMPPVLSIGIQNEWEILDANRNALGNPYRPRQTAPALLSLGGGAP
jgi:hypothetical protein